MNPDFVTGIFILVGLCGIPLAIPLIFGVIILKNFGKDEIGRLIGFLTLKPVVAFPIFIYLSGMKWINDIFWNGRVWGTALPLVFYILLTLCIIYLFKDILNENGVVKFSVVGDILSWLVMFVFWIVWNSMGVIIAETFLPTIYAVVSLIYIYKRSDLLPKP